MCTPAGHLIFGLSALDHERKTAWNHLWPIVLIVAVAANLPDIDFMFGWSSGDPNMYHQMWTHSLFFVSVMLIVIWQLSRPVFRKYHLSGFRILAAVMFSHLLLDLFGQDTRPPIGIPLFWPLSNLRITSPVSLFPSIHKASESELFIRSLFSGYNLKVMGVETGLIGGAYALFRIGRRRI